MTTQVDPKRGDKIINVQMKDVKVPTQVDQNRGDEDNSLPKLKRETETVPFTVGEVKPREIGSLDEDDGRISKAQGDVQPRDTKSLTTVEVRVYEGDKLMELRRHAITYAFPNSTDQILIAPKVLRAGEYPHDDQVTLFGFKVEIEAALQHIKVTTATSPDREVSDV